MITVTLGVGNADLRPKDLPFDLGVGIVFLGLVAAADFNGDHVPDLVGITQDVSGFHGGVVLLGVGDGTFRAPILLGPGAVVAAADFNNDGKLDLLVSPGEGFAVRLGNGDGTFQPAGQAAQEPVAFLTWAAVADFNGDGRLDLAGTTLRANDSGSVYVWLGNGDGTFGNATAIGLGASTFTSSRLLAADFNRDGHPDLAVLVNNGDVASREPYGVEILLGDGQGGFVLGNTYPVPAPAPPVAADFDHDGLIDLAAGFTILLGNGDGTFGPAQPFGRYGAPNNLLGSVVLAPPGGVSWVAAGDFNGDGKTDMVGPSGNQELSVLINTTPGSGLSSNAVSAADYVPVVAQGSIASIFGSGLATVTVEATGPPWPISLAGTSVRIGDAAGFGRNAQLLYVSPTQINFVVPPETAVGFAFFNVFGAQPVLSGGRSTLVEPLAPAFFTLNGAVQGPVAATAVRVQADGSQTPVPVAQCSATGCTLVPIDVSGGNVYLSLYGTGFQQANGAGCRFLPPGSPLNDTSNHTPLVVTYVGPQLAVPGLDQLNLRLPAGLPSGTLAIQCNFNSFASDTLAYANFSIAIP